VYLHLRVIKSCLIWTSLCMLFEVVTIDLHYMTNRRFDLKISKLKILLLKQRHLHLGCPWGKLKHQKLNYPFNADIRNHNSESRAFIKISHVKNLFTLKHFDPF